MTRIRMMLALVAALYSLFALMACQQDLDVRGRTFHCVDHDDCLEGFRCEAIDAERTACMPIGQADATDSDDPDVGDVSPPDTSDTSSDGDVAPDGSTSCTDGKSLCADQCVDLSTDPENCGSCGRTCMGGRTCQSGSCVTECPMIEASGSTSPSLTGDDITLSVSVLEKVSLGAFSSPEATAQSYDWELTKQPKGSTSKLTTPDQQEASLIVDLYGQYVVTLAVTYEGDVDSCESAKITINVAPTADIAVQLTWDTPSDPDQTDDAGANLDLHYLNIDRGSWESDWDAYSYNPDPNWGDQATSADDPKMLVDDKDGAGPEHLVHSMLDADGMYVVGVHYYNDAEFGASYAAVRIYVDGALVGLYDDQYLNHGEFWEVARISGPPDYQVTVVNRVHNTIP